MRNLHAGEFDGAVYGVERTRAQIRACARRALEQRRFIGARAKGPLTDEALCLSTDDDEEDENDGGSNNRNKKDNDSSLEFVTEKCALGEAAKRSLAQVWNAKGLSGYMSDLDEEPLAKRMKPGKSKKKKDAKGKALTKVEESDAEKAVDAVLEFFFGRST